jgi:molybdopterin-guanine dinucleotide biosynthesis protein A
MIGVVLCGGKSLRMGSDKGLLRNKEGVCWSASAYQKLAELKIKVVVSVNNQQRGYKNIFREDQLMIDNPSLLLGGPLLGLLSVHLQFPKEEQLVLACDMTDMKTEVLRFLYKKYNQKPDEAMVFSEAGYAEPLCGIYSSSGLKKIYSLYQNKNLPKNSMRYILSQLSTFQFELTDKWKSCFKNFNSEVNQ